MPVDLDDLLDGGGFEESGGHALLDAEDHAFAGGDADGGRAELDGLEGVLDLEEAAFGGEGAVGIVSLVWVGVDGCLDVGVRGWWYMVGERRVSSRDMRSSSGWMEHGEREWPSKREGRSFCHLLDTPIWTGASRSAFSPYLLFGIAHSFEWHHFKRVMTSEYRRQVRAGVTYRIQTLP